MTTDKVFERVLIGSVALHGGEAGFVYFQQYRGNSAPAIVVLSEDVPGGFREQYAVFSVNLVGDAGQLRPWEFFAKTYSENADLARSLAATPWFAPAIDVSAILAQHVTFPVWTLRPDELAVEARDQIAKLMGWLDPATDSLGQSPLLRPRPAA